MNTPEWIPMNTLLFQDNPPKKGDTYMVWFYMPAIGYQNGYSKDMVYTEQGWKHRLREGFISVNPLDRYCIQRLPYESAMAATLEYAQKYEPDENIGWIVVDHNKIDHYTSGSTQYGHLWSGIRVFPTAYDAIVASRSTLLAKVSYTDRLRYMQDTIASGVTILEVGDLYQEVNIVAAETLYDDIKENPNRYREKLGKRGVNTTSLFAQLYTETELYMPLSYFAQLNLKQQHALLVIHHEFRKYLKLAHIWQKIVNNQVKLVEDWGIDLLEAAAFVVGIEKFPRMFESQISPTYTLTPKEIANFPAYIEGKIQRFFGEPLHIMIDEDDDD